MSLRNRLIFNVKWHRRIGLLCAFFVIVLSITGLLLNHTASLKLDNIKLHSPILSSLYNLPPATPVSFHSGEQWISHNGINTLYLGQMSIEQCAPPLKGVVTHNDLLQILCEDELLLLTKEGDLLERITPVLGLPNGSQALAFTEGQLLIKTADGVVSADMDALNFIPSTLPAIWTAAETPTSELTTFLRNQGPAMDLEQVLLDLHSGRLFGGIGVLVMDLAAILLIVLSITGFIAWQTSRKMRGKR